MTLTIVAASERADAGEDRRISMDGLMPNDAVVVTLLFELLGWQVVRGCVTSGQMPDARLHMIGRRTAEGPDAVVQVITVDESLAERLAASGLDRLVQPLDLAALEQLSVLAG